MRNLESFSRGWYDVADMEAVPEPSGGLTPIEELYGKLPHLLTGDIVFVRHKKSFFRHFLRKVTDSYWDHSTMVLFPRNVEKKRLKHYLRSLLIL